LLVNRPYFGNRHIVFGQENSLTVIDGVEVFFPNGPNALCGNLCHAI
jgi:hypothetical protein